MIYVTHDQTEALTFADQVVVMYEGEVVQIGTPNELFERPAHTFVGYFIGSPGMNVLPLHGRGRPRPPAAQAIDRTARASLCRSWRRRSSSASGPEFVRHRRAGGIGLAIRAAVDDIGRSKIVRVELGGHTAQRHRRRGRARSPASAHASASIRRTSTSTPTAVSVEAEAGLSHGQDLEQQGLVLGPAGAGPGRVLGASSR